MLTTNAMEWYRAPDVRPPPSWRPAPADFIRGVRLDAVAEVETYASLRHRFTFRVLLRNHSDVNVAVASEDELFAWVSAVKAAVREVSDSSVEMLTHRPRHAFSQQRRTPAPVLVAGSVHPRVWIRVERVSPRVRPVKTVCVHFPLLVVLVHQVRTLTRERTDVSECAVGHQRSLCNQFKTLREEKRKITQRACGRPRCVAQRAGEPRRDLVVHANDVVACVLRCFGAMPCYPCRGCHGVRVSRVQDVGNGQRSASRHRLAAGLGCDQVLLVRAHRDTRMEDPGCASALCG